VLPNVSAGLISNGNYSDSLSEALPAVKGAARQAGASPQRTLGLREEPKPRKIRTRETNPITREP